MVENPKLELSLSPLCSDELPSTLNNVTSLFPLPPAPIRIAVPVFSLTIRIVEADVSPKSRSYCGESTFTPILPVTVIPDDDVLSFSALS